MRSVKSLLLDLFLVAAATVVALLLRDNFEIAAERLIAVAPYLLVTLSVAAIILPTLGVSRSLWQFTSMKDYLRIVAAAVATVVSAVAVGFVVNRLDGVARALPILQGVLIVVFLVGARIVMRLQHARFAQPVTASANGAETALVVGLNKLTELYLHCAAELAPGRLRIAGLLGESSRVGLSVYAKPVLGTPEQIASALRTLEVHGVFVDRVIVTVSPDTLSPQAQEALVQIQQTTTIRVEYLAERMGIDQVSTNASKADSFELSASISEFSAKTAANLVPHVLYRPLKRAIDIIASVLLLVILSPILLLVGLLVAVDVGWPVVFWQQRPGLGGRPFKLYKFRTMGAAHDEHGGQLVEIERLSRIGEFLRRTRFDELPQLYNILRGQMSFVGPRPLLPVDQPHWDRTRLLVRPGLTGWAQVNGGRDISIPDKTALDVWYVRNASMSLDLKIVVLTLATVVRGERKNDEAIRSACLEVGDSKSFQPSDPDILRTANLRAVRGGADRNAA